MYPDIRNGFVGTVTPFFSNKENGVLYLRGTNVHDGVINNEDVVYVSRDFHKKHIRTELKSDDIIMVQSGHVGECAVVGEGYAGANCHALIVMSNGGKCNSKYIVYYLSLIHICAGCGSEWRKDQGDAAGAEGIGLQERGKII